MFNVKETIKKRKEEGKHLVKFKVLGFDEKHDITTQLEDLGLSYEVYSYDDYDITPYDILVGV